MDESADSFKGTPEETTAKEPGTTRPRLTRNPSPWRMLERIDRQWSEPAPFDGPERTVISLALTVPEDPRAFDYWRSQLRQPRPHRMPAGSRSPPGCRLQAHVDSAVSQPPRWVQAVLFCPLRSAARCDFRPQDAYGLSNGAA